MNTTTGAQRLLDILIDHGIDTLSGIPGGSILPLYDAVHKAPIRHILARHEQGAAFIAQGIARATGKLGVCLATSGPGATNLITGLADAWRDSIPVLAITGQVPRAFMGTQAFQEIDIASMASSCTKGVWRISQASEIDTILPQAIAQALSGRPGPVLVDIPKDVFLERCATDHHIGRFTCAPREPEEREILEASRILANAQRPLLIAGGGIASANAAGALRAFAEGRGIPVASTLLGLGSIPSKHPLSVGMIGMHGTPAANHALQECDLLIVAGARFDDRATGRLPAFAPQAMVIHLDTDSTEFGRLRSNHASIHGDARSTLERWHELDSSQAHPKWLERIATLCESHPLPKQPAHDLMRAIAQASPPGSLATTDVGQHQMWAAQSWPIDDTRQFLTSGGLGTMGFGLPTAIGAALACPDRHVICLSGDGSILMNIQELATLAELELPVTICVFDNGHLGLVRQQQTLFFGDRRIASRFERSPDLTAIAVGFGISSQRIESWQQDDSWQGMLGQDGPAMLVFAMDPEESVWPMVPPGGANTEMLMPNTPQ